MLERIKMSTLTSPSQLLRHIWYPKIFLRSSAQLSGCEGGFPQSGFPSIFLRTGSTKLVQLNKTMQLKKLTR